MTMGDRNGALAELADQLWPAPQHWSLGGKSDPREAGSDYLVTPSLKSPRLVVPRHRLVAARVAFAEGHGRPSRQRMKSAVLAAGLLGGLGARGLGHPLVVHSPKRSATAGPSLREHLSAVVGQPIDIAFQVTRARANRKPVLRLVDRRGRSLAFVKVGGNPLTRELVGREHDALRALASARLQSTTLPRVLACEDWNDLRLLVLSPLPLRMRSRRPDPALIARSAREIAESAGVYSATLGSSAYVRELRNRASAVTETTGGAIVDESLRHLLVAAGDVSLAFGAWHGDWAPWNFAGDGQRLLVWDLERYAADVPVGFDPLHCALQTAVLPAQLDARDAMAQELERTPRLLESFGLSALQSRIVCALYLAEISTRWLADRQDAAGRLQRALDTFVEGLEAVTAQVRLQAAGPEDAVSVVPGEGGG